MAEKTSYPYMVEAENVDFTLKATVSSLVSTLLNTAGTDAHRKGFGIDALGRENLAWVLSRLAVEIDSRPEQYSGFGVNTWVNDNGRLVSTRNFEAYGDDGTIFCRAVSQWCLLDFVKRVPVALSVLGGRFDDMRCDEPSPCPPPRKIAAVEPDETFVHKVVYSDIDFNCHVNTMRYLSMMIDMMPTELLKENRPLRLDAHFMRECRLGQTLQVGYRQAENVSMFEVNDGEGNVACRAYFEWL